LNADKCRFSGFNVDDYYIRVFIIHTCMDKIRTLNPLQNMNQF